MCTDLARREWARRAVFGVSSIALAAARATKAYQVPDVDAATVRRTVLEFIARCERADGGYAPSPDPAYCGNSDTKLSDLAAVTYAAVLARTLEWELPHPARSVAFIRKHQKPDGRFVNLAGEHDPQNDLGILYNTTQGVVGLHALGETPAIDPAPVMERFFEHDAYRKLPWYTTSFFPLFYKVLGKTFPSEYRRALASHMERNQAEDGYLGDHVAATFHMAHFYRLLGEPTPGAQRMVARVLRDQKRDGGWDIKNPDWDVHACFDAAFILRQVGGDAQAVRAAISKGADWALACRNPDGGFGHYRGRHSDMDAVYFQLGTLFQAGRLPGSQREFHDADMLGWGHAMKPAHGR
jgi:geranylgeranyl transferase type-2 subunit beta